MLISSVTDSLSLSSSALLYVIVPKSLSFTRPITVPVNSGSLSPFVLVWSSTLIVTAFFAAVTVITAFPAA